MISKAKLQNIIFECDMIITGKYRYFPTFKHNKENTEMLSTEVIKYVMRTYFYDIRAEDCELFLTPAHFQKLNLTYNTFFQYVPALKQLNVRVFQNLIPSYVASLLQPNKFKFTDEVYIPILCEHIASTKKAYFPEGFFDGVDGRERLIMCNRYFLESGELAREYKVGYLDKEGLYRFYSRRMENTATNRKAARTINIIPHIEKHFDSPVELLYETIKTGFQVDKFLFYKYSVAFFVLQELRKKGFLIKDLKKRPEILWEVLYEGNIKISGDWNITDQQLRNESKCYSKKFESKALLTYLALFPGIATEEQQKKIDAQVKRSN